MANNVDMNETEIFERYPMSDNIAQRSYYKTWKAYVRATRMETTCGEVPYYHFDISDRI